MITDFKYITDSKGNINSIVLPIEYWKRINCDDETEFLLQNEANKSRLMESINRKDYIPQKDAYERLGI